MFAAFRADLNAIKERKKLNRKVFFFHDSFVSLCPSHKDELRDKRLMQIFTTSYLGPSTPQSDRGNSPRQT